MQLDAHVSSLVSFVISNEAVKIGDASVDVRLRGMSLHPFKLDGSRPFRYDGHVQVLPQVSIASDIDGPFGFLPCTDQPNQLDGVVDESAAI